MSRSGYDYDGCYDTWASIRYYGAVKSAFRGKRGQAFLKEMLAALDAMPVKELVANVLINTGRGESHPGYDPADHNPIVGGDELVDEKGNPFPIGAVCAMGAVGKARGLDMTDIDPNDPPSVAGAFNIAETMAREIADANDDFYKPETPAQRWVRMRKWVENCIIKEPPESIGGGGVKSGV
jgi:hypothetical protein